ncbi:YcxB family protein [Clostridium algidicarnis]|uniref:YcxB-like protein n=1 Tax=Clostridium algidicarnis DSM 15099 TaxID=1121295 RepID=A0A2S6FUU2_9CLOT|nr:YcxB family protein [Clostridium algidicarnis]MBB6698704.1 YcxB family protein [Clostridium algidicarnis]MBU3197362.1 YcxB family protein [Clostridium algidicarnis]MBU3207855.1 YcxB family protein [Clostridium algidicarnis]PPK44668.1 hypothetical protein BD821_12227 [Clostridium algidicarnis DSM 15099]
MKLKYSLTKEEFIDGQVDNIYNSFDYFLLRTYCIFIGIPIFTLGSILLKFSLMSIILGSVWLFIILEYIIKRKLLRYILRKKISNIAPNKNITFSWDFTEEIIYIHQNENKLSFQWSHIIKIVDTKKYIQIFTPINEKIFISKCRAFNDDNDLENFYSILKENIQGGKFNNYKYARKPSNVFKELKSRTKNLKK